MTTAADDVLMCSFCFTGQSYITLHFISDSASPLHPVNLTLHYISFQVRPHHYIRSILPRGPVGVAAAFWNGDQLLEVIHDYDHDDGDDNEEEEEVIPTCVIG